MTAAYSLAACGSIHPLDRKNKGWPLERRSAVVLQKKTLGVMTPGERDNKGWVPLTPRERMGEGVGAIVTARERERAKAWVLLTPRESESKGWVSLTPRERMCGGLGVINPSV